MNKILHICFQTVLFLLFAFPLFKVNIVNFLFILLITLGFINNPKKIISFFTLDTLKFTVPFWIVLCTSIYCIGQENWYEAINNALPFLIYPLAFFLIPKDYFTSDLVVKYFKISKISCTIILFFYIGTFLYYYTLTDFFEINYRISKFREFVYNETSYFKIHPTYYTLLLVFLVGDSLENLSKKITPPDLCFVILSFLITFLLLSKITIVLLTMLVVFYILKKVHLPLKKKILIVSAFIGVIVLVGLKMPGIYDRFKEIYISLNNPPKGVAHDSTNVRVAIYNCDINILQENLIRGVGFHYIDNEIHNCLKSKYNATFYENTIFLSHNYFIYMLMGSGIFGFLFFLFYVFKIIKTAIKINSPTLYLLLVCVFVGCLTEDFLFRNFGTFFLHIYFFMYLKNNLLFNDNKNTINH